LRIHSHTRLLYQSNDSLHPTQSEQRVSILHDRMPRKGGMIKVFCLKNSPTSFRVQVEEDSFHWIAW
jgi:hypothetical protein